MAAAEVSNVISFFKTVTPFQFLSESDIRAYSKKISVTYVRNGDSAHPNQSLNIIRKGALEIFSESQKLVDRIADGECFGVSSLLSGNKENFSVTAIEDSLIYQVSKEDFLELVEKYPQVKNFFEQTRSNRLQKLMLSHKKNPSADVHWNASIQELMSRNLICISPDSTIQEAAKKMADNRVGSILIIENNELKGIVTDRDLRTRVVSQTVDIQKPIELIATKSPITLDEQALVMHAHLTMTHYNVHHLPIVNQQEKPVGMVTATNLLNSHQNSPLLLVSEIYRQQTIADLSVLGRKLPSITRNLMRSGMSSFDIGEVLSVLSDSFTKKLIELAELKLGPAPTNFAWVCFGSQARKDQSLGSDQDNGLVFEHELNELENKYFEQFSNFICNGLAECGFPLCPGSIMATNQEYRMSVKTWQKKFESWIQSPTPKSLLNACIFFDIRMVHGDQLLVKPIKDRLKQWCPSNQIFIATLSRNAAQNKTPLGFFKTFVVDRHGDHKHQLDLKHAGIAIIHDIARTYALSEGITISSSKQRLLQLEGRGSLSNLDIENLVYGLEFLLELRFEAQLSSQENDKTFSNYLNPSELNGLRRQQLKSVFAMIHAAQQGLVYKFSRGVMV